MQGKTNQNMLQGKSKLRLICRQLRVLSGFLFFASLIFITVSCQDLDEDDGYFDKETGLYKYVYPNRKGRSASDLKVQSPRPGKTQQNSRNCI